VALLKESSKWVRMFILTELKITIS